jgi:hypothetical protein
MTHPARRLGDILVRVCWCVVAAAVPAHAAARLPSGAHLQIGRVFDAPTFARAIARSYHVRVAVNQIVTADVDLDGDIDVITASEGAIVFWVNDGRGMLSSTQASRRSSSVDGPAPAGVRHSEQRGVDVVSAQEEPPSTAVRGVYVHGPPLSAEKCRLSIDPTLHVVEVIAPCAPRAPPI